MKKYIKNTNLVPVDNKIKIFNSVSDIPTSLTNEVVIVEDVGIFKCNGNTITKIYNDGRNVTTSTVGEVKMFYGNTIPTGWLECNGSTFDTSQYASLYNFLGTNKVPDYRECTLRGGTTVGTFSDDAMGSHSHTFSGGCHSHSNSGATHTHTYCGVWYSGKGCRAHVCPSSVYYFCCPVTANVSSTTCGYTNTTTPSICGNSSGITVGASPWASTVTRAREIGVRFIICTGE